MSGLYNMLMGRNPAAPYLLGILGITQQTADQWPLGRLRDVYTNDEGTKVFVFTRNGGLENEDQEQIESVLKTHPHYVSSQIDSFDTTYLTYEFNTPEEYRKLAKEIAEVTETEPPMVRFRRLLDDMQAGRKNEMVDNALQVGKKIFGAIFDGKDGTVEHDHGSVEVISFRPEPEQSGDESNGQERIRNG